MLTTKKALLVIKGYKPETARKIFKFEGIEIIHDSREIEIIWSYNKTPMMHNGDMDEDTSLYELLFKLLHALRDRKRIELTRDYFSRRLLRHLYDQDALKPTEYNDNDGYNDYEFMLNMFNRRSPMTEKQRRKVNAIIYFSIKPHLENVLANKTKKVQECPQKS